MTLEILRTLTREMKSAHADADDAAASLLHHERRESNSISELHGALSVLGDALQRATTAQRELCRVLALDPEKLTAQEPLVPPLLEGTAE